MQPVASRYTDYPIPANNNLWYISKTFHNSDKGQVYVCGGPEAIEVRGPLRDTTHLGYEKFVLSFLKINNVQTNFS
jgi:hypothetical protein